MTPSYSSLTTIATYLRWTEVSIDSIILVILIYIIVIIYTTKFVNTIEWQFTKLAVILDITHCVVSISYYPIYTYYPNSILLCQIAGVIKPCIYAICLLCVLILITVRFMRYFMRATVKNWTCYAIFISLTALGLAICLYFAILGKMRHTQLGYCFIDPLLDESSRFVFLFILLLGQLAAIMILVNYTLLCRLGLQMGSYISSEELPIDKNSIVEKSIIIVILKSVSIMLTYTITLLPKIISISYQVIYRKSMNPLFDIIADLLLALNAIPNLLTTVLLNSIIREKMFNFNKF